MVYSKEKNAAQRATQSTARPSSQPRGPPNPALPAAQSPVPPAAEAVHRTRPAPAVHLAPAADQRVPRPARPLHRAGHRAPHARTHAEAEPDSPAPLVHLQRGRPAVREQRTPGKPRTHCPDLPRCHTPWLALGRLDLVPELCRPSPFAGGFRHSKS